MSLISFLILFFSSLVASNSFVITMFIVLMKDLAESGYVLDSKDTTQTSNIDTESDDSKLHFLLMITPIINILFSLFLCLQYIENKNDIFSLIDVMGNLREMTEDEKKEYEKSKNIKTLLSMIIKKTDDKKSEEVHKESLLDSVYFNVLQRAINDGNFLEDDKSLYYILSNYFVLRKDCIGFKELDKNEAIETAKYVARIISNQLNDNMFLRIDMGYFIRNSLQEDKNFIELFNHLNTLYSCYNFTSKKAPFDLIENILPLTADNIVNISMDTTINKKVFYILDFNVFLDELKKQGLTFVGLDCKTYKDFINRLFTEGRFSIPIVIGRIKLNEESDNKDLEKPKELKKTNDDKK